jgi:D-sedoheptulose 7-phosphate isomerase
MDHYQTIARGFQETIELITMSVDRLADPIARAAHLCSTALVQERKILTCGNGPAATVAQLFTCNLVHRFEQERPALPVMCLSGDSVNMSAIAFSTNSNDAYARPVRALGQPGDILIGVAAGEGNSSIIQALRAAHDRDMTTIILSGGACGDISSLLFPEDVELHVPGSSPPRIIELQTMVVHSLCTLIDQSLFGTYDE